MSTEAKVEKDEPIEVVEEKDGSAVVQLPDDMVEPEPKESAPKRPRGRPKKNKD